MLICIKNILKKPYKQKNEKFKKEVKKKKNIISRGQRHIKPFQRN